MVQVDGGFKSEMMTGNGVCNDAKHENFQDHSKMEVLILPDLFFSLMSVPARQNPNYARVKADADEWIAS